MSASRLLLPSVFLGILLFAIFYAIDLDGKTTRLSEVNRQLRVDLQRLQQVQSRLAKSQGEEAPIEVLQKSDALRVSLIEEMLVESWPSGISDVSYEFHMLPSSLMNDSKFPIETLRVTVEFTAQHALLVVSYLDSLTSSVHPQPIEVRACESIKIANTGLKNHCAIDLHYWGGGSDF